MYIGKNCYLRFIDESDAERTWIWINDPELSKIMGVHGPVTREQQIEYIKTVKNSIDKKLFAICLKATNEHIGNISLREIDDRNKNAQLSIFIYDKKYHGKGIGSDALKLLLQYAFNVLNLHKVYLKTSQEYIAAVKMYKRLGFSQEGILREHELKNGKYENKLIFSILKNEFDKDE